MARGAGFDICAQVLRCIRKILDDDNILYATDLRAVYGWDDDNFIQLASDLESCFAAAGHPIPNRISRAKIRRKKKIEDVCPVVEDAFKPKNS